MSMPLMSRLNFWRLIFNNFNILEGASTYLLKIFFAVNQPKILVGYSKEHPPQIFARFRYTAAFAIRISVYDTWLIA
jgi:hypothetical protein